MERPADTPGAETLAVEVADLGAARELMEILEEQGVPSHAIALDGVEDDGNGGPDDAAVTPMVGAVGRSMLVGVVAGVAIGSLVALFGSVAVWGGVAWVSALLGGLFGGLLGAVMGGMAEAKYNTRDRVGTYDAPEAGPARVAVTHADASVVATARAVMRDFGNPTR